MQYWEIVTRSFRIAWDHKYLWLIALFSGEGGGGFNYNYSQRSSTNGSTPDLATPQNQVTTWLNGHIALVVSLVLLWLALVLVFLLLPAGCQGATARPSPQHDADPPVRLRPAWRAGV